MTQKVVARICDCGKRLDYDRIQKRWYCSDCEPNSVTGRSEFHNYEEYLFRDSYGMTRKRLFLSRLRDYNEAKRTFDTIFTSLSQAEDAAKLIRHLTGEQRVYHILLALIDCLLDKNIYVYLKAKEIGSFLNDYGWTNYEKVRLLDSLMNLLDFRCRKKELPEAFQDYLNENDDRPEDRYAIIGTLLKEPGSLREEALEKYILFHTEDGSYKSRILELIFQSDFVGEYLRDGLLQEYLAYGKDDAKMTLEVAMILAEQGFYVDEKQIDELIKGPGRVNDLLQALLENGSPCGRKAVENYIIYRGSEFSGTVLEQLMHGKYMVSPQAFITYLLDITDKQDRNKATHFRMILGVIPTAALGSQMLRIGFWGSQIRCNLLQAYVINGKDSLSTARSIVSQMMSVGVTLNGNISVDDHTMAFKRLVKDNREILSKVSNQLCDENLGRRFSLF